MSEAVLIGDGPLALETIHRVVFEGVPVALAPAARQRVEGAADFVAEQARTGHAVYGVTTGFGANRDTLIDPKEAGRLQENILLSHASGVGPPLAPEVVRAMLLLRVHALALGYSGIRARTLDALVTLLNRGVLPVVPEHGSLGASGDLCPLAHMCLPLIGHGEADLDGRRVSGAEALAAVGLAPLRLTFKEGLALVNGTQAMTALGIVAAWRLERLLDVADAVCAVSLDALAGRSAALDPRLHALRNRSGQDRSAAHMRVLLTGSQLVDAAPGAIAGKQEYVHDSYCLRCAPQVHGASRDVLTHVRAVLLDEANAVTDNPLVFADTGDILSGGNFHGEPVAMALDYLKIAITELASISERRSAKLVDKAFNEGLPAFLVYEPGLNSGLMIPQYVAAALVSECKVLAHPASVDSIPSSANVEDHVSMGCHAGRHAVTMVEHARRVVAIELLLAAQALDLRRPLQGGRGSRAILELVRRHVPFLEADRYLSPDIEALTTLVGGDALRELVLAHYGEIGRESTGAPE